MSDRFSQLTQKERDLLGWAAWVSRLDNNVPSEDDEILSALWIELTPENGSSDQ